jgi:DNA-binding protein H-NS
MPTLEQIQAKLKKLQAQEELLIAKRNQSILNQIRKLMETHGLTTADIEAHGSTPAKRRGRPAGSSTKPKAGRSGKTKTASNGKLPAKYRDPKSGATWSGWARPPLWIKGVKDRSKFLIDGSAEDDATKNASRKTSPSKTVNASVKGAKPKRATAKKFSRKSSATKADNVVNPTSTNNSAE